MIGAWVRGGSPWCDSWATNGLVLYASLIDSWSRHTEILCELSDLLVTCTNAKTERPELEDAGRSASFSSSACVASLWLILLLTCCSMACASLLTGLAIRTLSSGRCATSTADLYSETCRTILIVCGGRVARSGDGAPACRAHLLAFEPTSKTAEMQCVTTGELFGSNTVHRTWV